MAAFITRRHLSRRTLLRGAGAALALPLLESMVPAMSAVPTPRTRFGAIYFPHGATMSRWTPKDEGRDFTFSEILQPLAPFRAQHQRDLQPGASAGLRAGRRHRQPQPLLRHLPQRRPGGVRRAAAARHHRGPGGREAPRAGHAAAVAGADDRGCQPELRRGAVSCAYRNTLSWQSETLAAADAEQSAGAVRAAVRRWRRPMRSAPRGARRR